jgi:hypothetical protein
MHRKVLEEGKLCRILDQPEALVAQPLNTLFTETTEDVVDVTFYLYGALNLTHIGPSLSLRPA